MIELDYRIIHGEYDDFIGQNGFFQIKCNGYSYGEIYPKELETGPTAEIQSSSFVFLL